MTISMNDEITAEVASNPFNIKNPIHFLALGFGAGLIKPAPGTWGTVVAIPIYFLLVRLPQEYFWASIAAVCLIGIFICHIAAKDAGVHDHGSIVWDEIAGYLVTMALVPAVHVVWALAGFILFRIFDILKPFPINLCDKYVKGGFGIMLDDIVAGLYAMGCMYLVIEAYKYHLGI